MRENLAVISESSGKSYVAQVIDVSARRRLMSVRYVRLTNMFRRISAARSDGLVRNALDCFSNPDLLMLDDFFTTLTGNPPNVVNPFEMMKARKSRSSMLIASRLEPDQWYLRINSDPRG